MVVARYKNKMRIKLTAITGYHGSRSHVKLHFKLQYTNTWRRRHYKGTAKALQMPVGANVWGQGDPANAIATKLLWAGRSLRTRGKRKTVLIAAHSSTTFPSFQVVGMS